MITGCLQDWIWKVTDRVIVILVASESGTAEFVADELSDSLKDKGFTARVVPMHKASLQMFEQRKLYIVCSSTHGTGEVPESARPFCEVLTASRPDLSDVRYGMVALGDMTYSQTFCGGGKRIDGLLSELGARRMGERLELDRRSGQHPEALALTWLEAWLPLLDSAERASL